LFHVTTGWSQASSALLTEQSLSGALAIVLLVTYVSWLFFSLFTHKHLFEGEKNRQEGLPRRVKTSWPVGHALAILAIAAILIAVMSEFVSGTVETVCKSLHLSELFVGVVIVATIGNASEVPAVLFAIKNRMDLALGITIGSTLQVALFITPVLVLASYFLGSPMNLEFSLPEVAAVTLAVGVVALISGDGECNWIEGVQLIAVYAIIALLFYCLP
jgi:Ca2+:H+ antiporter